MEKHEVSPEENFCHLELESRTCRLFVTDVLKEQSFKVQIQQSDDVDQYNVYDLKKIATLKVHFDQGLKTVVCLYVLKLQ